MRRAATPLLSIFYSALLPAQVNVLTANYGNDRANANLQEALLTTANVAPGSFGKVGTLPADGEIFAQPLYVSGVNIDGQGTHNVLLIATQHNSLYAYDADQTAPAVLLWRVNLGPSVPSSTLDSDTGAFTDVFPEVGILSTGTVDPQAGVVYIVAETLSKGGPIFQLHALDLANGQERMNGPVTISGIVSGTGQGSTSDGILPFDPLNHLQRTGLLLANGAVSIAFGSHGDSGMWHGWVMSYNASDLTKQLGTFSVTPDGLGGAVWQSGHGLAADDAGNTYFITGNGDYDGTRDFGETFVKLGSGSLALSDWYTPADWEMLADNDYDLSAGPALIPGTHTLVGGDKAGFLYLINGDSMGHLDNGSAVQVFPAVNGFIFTLALWNRPDATYLYVREGNASMTAFRIVGGNFDPNPVSSSSLTGGGARIGMALSANSGQDGTGILWVTTGEYRDPSTPGILHAYNASDLSNELWNSAIASQDSLNGFVKFVSPTVANGKVYTVAGGSVTVYGLLAGTPSGRTQPVVAAALNAASYGQVAISPGELITLFGADLGPTIGAGLQLDASGKVATTLSNTQVEFDGVPAPMVYAASNQVSAIVPFGLSASTTQVQVLYQGQASVTFPMTVVPATPGLFSADGTGTGQALASNQDGSVNNGSNSAQAGTVIVLYATGAGQTAPILPDGSVVSADLLPVPILPVTVAMGGIPAEVVYAGGAPGLVAGVLQVNVRVPDALAGSGPVPVVLQAGGQSSQAGLTVAIQ
ncbi:MAG TPA: hypothetical protein VKU19_23315 [Bryobacteraceae bacterium]|nr:hypothetical protein [Bryobacteraceae bacterium]